LKAASVLLNGFKRYRCARKLCLPTVPYACLGQDQATGILSLLRTSNNRALSILEQAAFIDELKNARQMSVAEIAVDSFKAINEVLGQSASGAQLVLDEVQGPEAGQRVVL